MKYETIDGEKFDCELEALRHENDVLTDRLNNCREMCVNDRLKAKQEHNKEYGKMCTHIYPHEKQVQMYRDAILNMINAHDVKNVNMDTDSFLFIIPDGEIVEDPVPAPVDFSKIPTWALIEELQKRSGVKTFDVAPQDKKALIDEDSGAQINIEGPAHVLVVVD